MVPAIRNLLGGFLFSGDDIYKKAGVLSGGERTRLAVARMLLRPSNTLLLDEPTNHLDLDSKDVLLEALEDYGGTLIIVSHDRYFVEKLATKIIEIGHGRRARLSRDLQGIPVAQGRLSAFGSGLWTFPNFETEPKPKAKGPRQEPGAQDPKPRAPKPDARIPNPESREDRKRIEAERKKRDREAQALQRRIADLEGRIAEREAQVKELEARWRPPVFTRTEKDRNRSSIVIRR